MKENHKQKNKYIENTVIFYWIIFDEFYQSFCS